MKITSDTMALPLIAVRPFHPHFGLRGRPHQLNTVIFDVARTIMDSHGAADVHAIQSVFSGLGHDVSRAEIMVDTGVAKRLHLHRIARRRGLFNLNVDSVYASNYLPALIESATRNSTLFPDFKAWWETKPPGIKTGVWSSTYPRSVLDPLLQCFADQGVKFDGSVCQSDGVNLEAPTPHALAHLFRVLDVDCPCDAVFVGSSSSTMLAAAALNCVATKYVDTQNDAVLDERASNDGTHVIVTDYESQLPKVLDTYSCR